MISEHNLEKLLQHNFIDLFTRDELVRATQPHTNNWFTIANNLKEIITEIERYELEHPLGMNYTSPLWVNSGYWDYDKKEYNFSSYPDDKFTLEDLKFYSKLLTFLKVVDIQ